MQAYKWLSLKLCIFMMVHFFKAKAHLTVTPVGDACPGEDMTFTCRNASNDLLSVRWTLMRGSTEVITQIALTQSSNCPSLQHYNSLPIMVTLHNSYSTLNIPADDQLHGIMVECVPVIIGISPIRETISIQINQPPSPPSNLHIASVHNASYSATVELVWDFNQVDNDTHYSVSMSSNGETWFSTATIEDRKASITISYNMEYTLGVIATNCAGHSEVSSKMDIFLANCSAPIITDAEVVVEPYNNTVEGAVVYFNCDEGFVPNERKMAVCQSNGHWSPEILYLTCEQGNSIRVDQTQQEALNVTLNHTGLNSNIKPDFIYGRVESLASFTVASFVLGMICGVLFLLLPYLAKKRCEATKKKKIELSLNTAYETIPPKVNTSVNI